MAERPVYDHDLLATDVINRQHIKVFGKTFYAYNGDPKYGPLGYNVISDDQLRSYLHKQHAHLIHVAATKGDKDGVKTLYKASTAAYITEVVKYMRREVFIQESNASPDHIYVNNGILDTRAGKLIDPTPDIFVATRIPVTFDPDATCPAIDHFIKDITTDNGSHIEDGGGSHVKVEHDPNDVLTLEEMFGYALEPTYFVKKAIILLGKRHSGKTTYFSVMHKFLGKSNVSTLDLYQFGDRFSVPMIVGKLANIGDDFGRSKLTTQAMGLLKQLTGNTSWNSTRKARTSDGIDYIANIKIYFGGNNLPSVTEFDDAFIDRWHILQFQNHYPINGKFRGTLLTDSEMSGLLNKALLGLRRLRENEAFSKFNTQRYRDLFEMFKAAKMRDSRILSEKDIIQMPKAAVEQAVKDSVIGPVAKIEPVVAVEQVVQKAEPVAKVEPVVAEKPENWWNSRKEYTKKNRS